MGIHMTNLEADETYAMLVSFMVLQGHLATVVDLFEAAMPRIRSEEGCLAFRLFADHDSDVAWVYERYVTKTYHDEIHEAYPEIQALLAELPPHLDGGWTEHSLRQLIQL
jgi:quinol monooxygenase YgiN